MLKYFKCMYTHTDCKAKGNGQFVKCWKAVGLRRVWVWRPQLRLKPATHTKKRGSFKITPSTVVWMIDVFL